MRRVRVVVPLVTAVLLSAASAARAQAPCAAGTTRPPHGFRLGTAARPFGWSTAIGDLNADGQPDIAITDRIGRLGDGFSYSLELTFAGLGTRWLTFDAPDAALAIALLDIDYDHDLDVVVSAPFSRAVVRVWLNDGQGGFHEAAPPPSNAVVGDERADSATPSPADAHAIVPSARRHHASNVGDACPAAAALAGTRASIGRPLTARTQPPSPLRPRAPPHA
jgi:hypothetical protein